MNNSATTADQVGGAPSRRMVLLGASNVTRAFSTLVHLARQTFGPLEILGAFGHGRSYGQRMSMLGRALPGIAECGLWSDLARRPPLPTVALVTDVGNDLLYDVPVPTIAGWVETCLDRLQQNGARAVLTPLPLCNIERVPRRRFLLLRTILFPACRLSYETVMHRARELDQQLRSMAARMGTALAEPSADWYGFDAIHWRRRQWPAVWRTCVAAGWSAVADCHAEGPIGSRRLPRLVPERRWLFGWERVTAQPATRLQDGTTLSVY